MNDFKKQDTQDRGRKPHNFYKELGYEAIHFENGRMGAQCTVCNSILKNTAIARLRTHRTRCHRNSATSSSSLASEDSPRSENVPTSHSTCSPTTFLQKGGNSPENTPKITINSVEHDQGTEQEVQEELLMEVDINTGALLTDTSFRVIHEEAPACSCQLSGNHFSSSCSTTPVMPYTPSVTLPEPEIQNVKKPNRKRHSKATRNLNAFIDKMSEKENEAAHLGLAKFFFGCNISFSVIGSDHFKNFMKLLRPAYIVPSRKTLSTTLLDKVHEQIIIDKKNSLKKSATLLIDGWKNSSNNTNNVVTMLQNVNGESVFLESYDFSITRETGEALAEVCNNAIEAARSAYNCEVYAVVSDNASNMVKMGRLTHLWHSTCASHTGNLLVKDIVNVEIMKTVTVVLKEFKHTTLENLILQRSGLKIVLPIETRWCSHRDSCKSLLNNLQIMKQIAAEDHYKIKAEVTYNLYNEEFIESVKETVTLLDPVCKIINKCQDKSTSIADSAEEWLILSEQMEIFDDNIKACIKSRVKMVLNIYSLAANYLHPDYRGHLLSKEQKQQVQQFLIENLDSEEGLEGLNAFNKNESIFAILQKKQVSFFTFWGLAESKYESLSCLAQKLLSIPASSAQLERLFSNWSFVHSELRNRLTKERSRKLVSVYYSLKLKDTNISDQY